MLRDEKYGTSLSDVGLSLPSSIANSSERRSYDEEILKSIIKSDDVNRIMKQLTPHIQETNHSLERQVNAIEQIAFEAKKCLKMLLIMPKTHINNLSFLL